MSISAAELIAMLERDPEYRARLAKEERSRQAEIVVNRDIASSIVHELQLAGFPIKTLTDLRKMRNNYPRAIPILLDWLLKIENLDVKQDIVRCLSVPYAKPLAAPVLINEFRNTKDDRPEGLRWTIGNALEVVADDTVIDEMIELASDPRYGRAREMLVVGLGNLNRRRVIPVLISLLQDDEVCGHSIVALGKLAPSSARTNVEAFLKHSNKWIRKAAKDTIKAIDKAGGDIG